jgi:hypothetical protein
MFAGPQGVADDGVLLDAGEATGLANAAAFLEVGEDLEDFVIGEAGIEQGRALALGEALLAGTAREHAALLAAIAESHAQVAQAALAVVGTVGVLTAEAAQVVGHRWSWGREKAPRGP